MDRQKLAQKLIEENPENRRILLERYGKFCDVALAEALQKLCYEIWTSAPQKVSAIVETLREISKTNPSKEIEAYADWTEAIENLVNGRLEDCLKCLDKSEALFGEAGKEQVAATTQISKLYALALLGRYDEAVACGRRARDVFLGGEDLYSAGKIEHNIGNLYLRRDLYREAEPYLASAHRRFSALGDQSQMAMLENNLAFALAAQNRFREAEKIYKKGLGRCEKYGLASIQADIEASMSNLYLFQGRFDRALELLERARRKYETLKMPHQTATSELEIADIYLELNLLPEAVGFYERTERKFAELGMQAELARSFLNHARALFLGGEKDSARALLERSEKLFEAEGNSIAAGAVKFAKAQIAFGENELAAAAEEAEKARAIFSEGGSRRHELTVCWLLGEISRARGADEKAREIISATLERAAGQSRQVEYLCLVSLGKITGDEKFFRRAVALVENSRASLSAEEFRTAFLADKVRPYAELVRIRLAAGDVAGAFAWHERARARTLLEAMTTDDARTASPEDKKLAALREELNWYYSRINRQNGDGLTARREAAALRRLAGKREVELAELERRRRIGETAARRAAGEFTLESLRKKLTDTALIEFAVFDGKLSAFVVTDAELRFFRDFADERTVAAEIRQFLFQVKTARFQNELSAANRRLALQRLLSHSQRLYDALLRPLEAAVERKRLIFAAANLLHYLPFQALHDGEGFLVEKREVGYAPSAAILQNCLNRPAPALEKALLVGVADRLTPLVETEIAALGGLFRDSVELRGKRATLKNLHRNVGAADVLHLACHGTFRPDNPAFSALALSGGNLTVGDARNLDLTNKLVTLSACETGLNKIVSGEELIGLMRGFLAAGARSLVLSLWTVSDSSTLGLMKNFYRHILSGSNLSRALQAAQIELLKENPHPYFWSPFIVVGHW
ncbi:MAG: CHAT domain-containing protein [Acidobacteria bacterium]|nr:CHAT domain-containing protein [Acidobacteriota bacterium]